MSNRLRKTLITLFKTVIVTALSIVLLGSALYIGFGLFGTVNIDSGTCGGGFRTWIVDTQQAELEIAAGEQFDEKQLAQIRENLEWNGREIRTEVIGNYGETIVFKGKRVWYERYKWVSI